MTTDLYRTFSQVFFPQHKYGNLSLFVCEFIEAKNGLIYFNQIKAFECDYKDVVIQIPKPLKRSQTSRKFSLMVRKNDKMIVHKDPKNQFKDLSKDKIHDQLKLGHIPMQTVCYLTIAQKFEILEIQGPD